MILLVSLHIHVNMYLAGTSGQTATSSAATVADTSSTAGARATPSAGATPFLPVPPDALQNILRVANGELRAQSAQPGVFLLLI